MFIRKKWKLTSATGNRPIKFYKKVKTITLEKLYLKPNSDFLGESTFREDSLDLGYKCTAEDPTLWTNQITVLLYPRNHSKVLWEISGDDTAYSFFLEFFWRIEFWKNQRCVFYVYWVINFCAFLDLWLCLFAFMNQYPYFHPCRWGSGSALLRWSHNDVPSSSLLFHSVRSQAPSLCPSEPQNGGSRQSLA